MHAMGEFILINSLDIDTGMRSFKRTAHQDALVFKQNIL